jgi:hypothetical protein
MGFSPCWTPFGLQTQFFRNLFSPWDLSFGEYAT